LKDKQHTIFEILTSINYYKDGGPRAPYYLKDLVKSDKKLAAIGEKNITIKDIETREKDLSEQQNMITNKINSLKTEYQAYKTKEKRINNLTSIGKLIIRKGIIAIQMYAKAHEELKITLERKQPMKLTEFASAVRNVANEVEKPIKE
jgi:hypothetical protein